MNIRSKLRSTVNTKFLILSLHFALALLFVRPVSASPSVTAGDFAVSAANNSPAAMAPGLLLAELGQDPEAAKGSVSSSYESVYMTLAVLLIVLVLVILLLLFIMANLNNLARIRDGKEAITMRGAINRTIQMALNPYINSAGTFVLLIVVATFLIPQARSVGLHQGYQPVQPIKFSHKIHAGDWKIDCQYCHSGASKGKNAWIPSVNVCMNCHKGIKEGKRWGTTEIEKIYKANESNKPIEWTRIHNLPDFVYFSHQQHVVAGGVECQKCHGPVETMDVLYQFSPLSMGWCVNCHRETNVNAELYKKLGREDVKTVEDIGGTNCARCHY